MISIEEVKLKTPKRFWSKIKFGDLKECWEWQYGTRLGYGVFWFINTDLYSHRFMYETIFGKLPSSKILVCHSCDNTKCVNPNHLFSGTFQDNMNDMKNKGRTAMGSKHGMAKLNEESVLEIKNLLMSGRTIKDVCEIYHVNYVTIMYIRNGKTWTHV